MSGAVRIVLEPLGAVVQAERGAPLRDALFERGVEFPCGGRAGCGRCRVRVRAGEVPVSPEQEEALDAAQLAAGWRLACAARAETDLVLEVAQWETPILADDSAFPFSPREGYGIAVDLGTTTLVAQLLDLATGRVLGVRTALNPQAVHGADIMSRVEFALSGGRAVLESLIRRQVGRMVRQLAAARPVRDIVLVGNTVMHHLFCAIDVEPLAHCPFEPVRDGLETFCAADLGWQAPAGARVRFLPCLGGFVGSDLLAGILAVGMHTSDAPLALIDMGTNGEVVVGNRERIVCASTAAGPAFEAGRIRQGMRAATGAIAEVAIRDARLECRVLGGGPARGICGSGLVDAVACALELGLVAPGGRLPGGELPLAPPVALVQRDVRELQLAKAATATGIRMVLEAFGATPPLARVYLAGAFGNYLNRASARRIGLIDFPPGQVSPAGNTALLGAKLALFRDNGLDEIRRLVTHLPLAADSCFQERYVEAMAFPA